MEIWRSLTHSCVFVKLKVVVRKCGWYLKASPRHKSLWFSKGQVMWCLIPAKIIWFVVISVCLGFCKPCWDRVGPLPEICFFCWTRHLGRAEPLRRITAVGTGGVQTMLSSYPKRFRGLLSLIHQ